jgi:hypothetical protein
VVTKLAAQAPALVHAHILAFITLILPKFCAYLIRPGAKSAEQAGDIWSCSPRPTDRISWRHRLKLAGAGAGICISRDFGAGFGHDATARVRGEAQPDRFARMSAAVSSTIELFFIISLFRHGGSCLKLCGLLLSLLSNSRGGSGIGCFLLVYAFCQYAMVHVNAAEQDAYYDSRIGPILGRDQC